MRHTTLCRAAATGRYQAWGVGNGYKRPAFRKFCGVGNFSESVSGVWGWADQDCNAQHIFICEIRREQHLPCAMQGTMRATPCLSCCKRTLHNIVPCSLHNMGAWRDIGMDRHQVWQLRMARHSSRLSCQVYW